MPLDSFCSVYSEKILSRKTNSFFFTSGFLFFSSLHWNSSASWTMFLSKIFTWAFSCVFIEKCLELSCTGLFRRKRSIGKFNLLWQRFQVSVCGNYQVQLKRMVCLFGFFLTNSKVYKMFWMFIVTSAIHFSVSLLSFRYA